MNCPKCENRLEARLLAGVEVEQCLNCQGVWLDVGELASIRREQNTHFGTAVPDTPIFDTLTGPCPRCGGTGHMTRLNDLRRPEVVIDTCPVCHGVWLDGGELDKLTEVNFGLSIQAFVRDLLD